MVLPIALLVSEKKLHWNAQLLFKLFSIYAYIYLSILFNKHLLCIFYVISEMLTNKNPKINNLWSWKVLCPSKMSNKGTNGIIHWGEWYCSVAGVNMTFYESIQNFSATLSSKYKVNTKMYKTNKQSFTWMRVYWFGICCIRTPSPGYFWEGDISFFLILHISCLLVYYLNWGLVNRSSQEVFLHLSICSLTFSINYL